MKGDIAVAGFRMTAEEWQSLDPSSRAELVNVITHNDDPQLAAGSGPIPVEHDAAPESGAVIALTDLEPVTGAILTISETESGAVVKISELDPASGVVVKLSNLFSESGAVQSPDDDVAPAMLMPGGHSPESAAALTSIEHDPSSDFL